MKIVIDIPEDRYKDIQRIASVQLENYHFKTAEQIIANGTQLPSVEPERPTAKWIMHSGGRQRTHAECGNCGMKNYAGFVNYCPNCGAKMEVDG